MHILIASNSYPTAKNPTRQVFVKNIEQELTKAGNETSIVYNRYFDLFHNPQETGSWFTKVLKTVFLIGSYLPSVLFRCRKVDIIYSHAPFLPGLLMVLASKIYGKKHVTYAHGSVCEYIEEKGVQYTLARYAMQQSDVVFTNSRYMKTFLKDQYNTESVVVTPGYNSKAFYNRSYERSVDILFAGNCIRRKGVHVLLEAIRDNKEYYQSQELSIKICCEGKEKPQVLQYCSDHHLTDFITIENRLEEDELTKAYNRAKVVVFPSLDEPLGLVGIEAIACGAFLIASDVGGIPEYIIHGKNGLLFEPGNSEALHKAITTSFDKNSRVLSPTPHNDGSHNLYPFSLEYGIAQTQAYFQELV